MIVTCVILETYNSSFVRQHLIPTLRASTSGHEVQVVVAQNGPEPAAHDDDVAVLRTELLHIGKGYNAGARLGNGELLAFFHDDCMINDPNWIDICRAQIDGGAWATGPDLRTDVDYSYLKEVPLVMPRHHFETVGGFDERYYLGFQSELLTFEIERHGGHITVAPFSPLHFCETVGMSTVLLLAPPDERRELQMLFGRPDFGPDQWRSLPGWPIHRLRAQWLRDYLIDLPLMCYFGSRFPGVPPGDRPTIGQLLRDGTLPSMMPSDGDAIEALLRSIDLANERIAKGAATGPPADPGRP